MNGTHRQPAWSGTLTRPMAERIAARRRPAVLRAIKAFHTAAFALIAGCILVFAWDGIRGRGGRRALVTAGVAITETLIYGSNNQVCPLTPLAEALGAESGTITDLYLPRPVSDRIPLLGGSALLVGLACHAFGMVAARERLMRSGRHHHDVTRCQPSDLRGHTAQHQSTKVRSRTRAQHDPVSPFRL